MTTVPVRRIGRGRQGNREKKLVKRLKVGGLYLTWERAE